MIHRGSRPWSKYVDFSSKNGSSSTLGEVSPSFHKKVEKQSAKSHEGRISVSSYEKLGLARPK